MGGNGKGKGGPPPPPSGRDAAKAKEELAQRKREQMEAEKREAQEAIALAKEREAKKRDFDSRLPTLRSHDIASVPWDTALVGTHLVGGKGTVDGGGVDVYELPGGAAVCARDAISIVTENIVDALAALLGVRVARMRLVQANTDESRSIRDLARRWNKLHFNPAEFEKYAAKMPPEDAAKARARFEKAGPYGVLEFVAGTPLDTAASALEAASPELLDDLGQLCALDLLLNNMDRLPLPCWGNVGNLTNAIVTPQGRLVGIDQQVNPVDAGPGLDAYLSEVRELSVQVLSGSAPGITGSVSAAIQKSTGVQLSDSSMQHVVEGMGTVLRKTVLASREGKLAETLAQAAASAAEVRFDFDGYYGQVTPIDAPSAAAKDVAFLQLVVEAVTGSVSD